MVCAVCDVAPTNEKLVMTKSGYPSRGGSSLLMRLLFDLVKEEPVIGAFKCPYNKRFHHHGSSSTASMEPTGF